jgi:hypothetical protein
MSPNFPITSAAVNHLEKNTLKYSLPSLEKTRIRALQIGSGFGGHPGEKTPWAV